MSPTEKKGRDPYIWVDLAAQVGRGLEVRDIKGKHQFMAFLNDLLGVLERQRVSIYTYRSSNTISVMLPKTEQERMVQIMSDGLGSSETATSSVTFSIDTKGYVDDVMTALTSLLERAQISDRRSFLFGCKISLSRSNSLQVRYLDSADTTQGIVQIAIQ